MWKCAKVTAPISNVLRRFNSDADSKWTRDAELAFFQKLFGEPPIPQHFGPAKPVALQTATPHKACTRRRLPDDISGWGGHNLSLERPNIEGHVEGCNYRDHEISLNEYDPGNVL